jgi:hypothetical protein
LRLGRNSGLPIDSGIGIDPGAPISKVSVPAPRKSTICQYIPLPSVVGLASKKNLLTVRPAPVNSKENQIAEGEASDSN